MTQAEFLRHLSEKDEVQSNSYKSFMSQGPLRMAGGSNKVYRLGYHFLEKVRLAEGKPKSKKRLQNEEELKKQNRGFRLIHDDGARWCKIDEIAILQGDRMVIVKR